MKPTTTLSTIGWAAYLAVSWTWCIGMWMPVLLLRDFGAWSFASFALPNCIGAAAMGWVIASPASSRRFVEKHGAACRVFSLVTFIFQVFFLASILHRSVVAGKMVATLAVAIPAVLTIMALPSRGGSASGTRRLIVAGIVWAVSAGIGVWFLSTQRLSLPQSGTLAGDMTGLEHAGLAASCTLGFMLCPYLDLTFHRARENATGAASGAAFGLGFCVLFVAMIVMTLFYGASLLQDGGGRVLLHPALLAAPLMVHMAMQLAFTMREHSEFMLPQRADRSAGLTGLGILLAAAGGVIVAHADIPSYNGFAPFEIKYRLFMSFYGLVFPAYIWICADWRDMRGTGTSSKPAWVRLAIFALAVMLAAPMFWLGFIERRYEWLLPGVGLVLIARVPAVILDKSGAAIRRRTT